MSGKKATLREMHQKKKQQRKPQAVGSQDPTTSSLRKQKKPQHIPEEVVGQKRKRNSRDDEDDEDSESEDESADELELTKNTEAEKSEFNFEFSDMKEDFYGGIQLMLAKQLYSTGAAHDLTEVIIKQDEVGTVVHCEGETDVFAYATIVPSVQLASIDFIKQLANYVDHHCQSATNFECKHILNAIAKQEVDSPKYGMLFHDRFVNFPLELIYQLHRNLSDDLSWILDPNQRSSEISSDLLESFDQMKYVVIFRPCAPESETTASSSSQTDLKVQNVTGSSSVMFDYFEDDVYFEQAEHAWKLKLDPKLFKVSNYIMMVVPKQNISQIANSLQTLLGC